MNELDAIIQAALRPINDAELIKLKQATVDDSIPYSTHEGEIFIGTERLRVAQLNTGERLIIAEDFERFLRISHD